MGILLYLDDYYHACGNLSHAATAWGWDTVTCSETVFARYAVIQVKCSHSPLNSNLGSLDPNYLAMLNS